MKRVLPALLAASLSFVTACSHTVIIDSDPTGAEIKVNGEKIGTSPVTYTETTGWEKIYEIEATKPGYKPLRKQVKQSEWNTPVTVASGLGFFVCVVPIIGVLWARQMPDRVVVNMERGGAGGDAGTAAPPSSYGY